MAEQGVTVINGSEQGPSASNSRSASPMSKKSDEDKPKRFLNGWSREQERLMSEWSDIAVCYRWLHDNSNKIFHVKTLGISLPVILLSTLSGFSNIGVQAILESDEAKKYASFVIAAISLMAGLLTTIGDRLRYAQLEESHRGAAISWGKFQRLIAVELALNPIDRMDSLDFLKICRAELDRLIEQSPPIPKESIALFEKKFGTIKDLKKPDICGALEHTHVFESSEARLKQAAVEAALILKQRKQTLNELVSPQIERRIAAQIETRLNEAIEARKMKLEDEIEQKRQEAQRTTEEMERALEDRKRRIREEIELEKKKLYQDPIYHAQVAKNGSQFESRLNYRRASIANIDSSKKHQKQSIYNFEGSEAKNPVIIPNELDGYNKIIVINKE